MLFFDLFAGIGGFHRGLEAAGHKCVGACEINEHARRVYARHFPQTKIWKDARKIDPAELPYFDCLAAGFPCHAFSIAGKRLAFAESRGTIFYEIIRIAKQKRPRLLLLENVEGLLSAGFAAGTGFYTATQGDGKGEITNDLRRVKDEPGRGWEEIKVSFQKGQCFLTILCALDEAGYDVTWTCLNSKYEVPQNRPRIFIVGHLRGQPRSQIFPLGPGSPETDGIFQKKQGKGKRIQANDIAGAVCSNYWKKGRTQTMIAESKLKKIVDGSQRATVYDSDGIAPTITSGPHGYALGLIAEPKLKKLIDGREGKRVYDPSGVSQTIMASPRGGQGGKSGLYAVKEPKLKKLVDGREAERVYDPSGISSTVKAGGGGHGGKSGLYAVKLKQLNDPTHSSHRVYDSDGLARTLKADAHDNSAKTGLYAISHTKANMKQRYQERDTAWTLDTSGSKMAVDDGYRIRRLTPQECEILQSFPPGWTKGLKDTQRYQCIGNAVTASVIEFIGRMLK